MTIKDDLNICQVEQILLEDTWTIRKKALATRQILREHSGISEADLKKLLETHGVIEEKAKLGIIGDLNDFTSMIDEIERESDRKGRELLIEELLFDLKLRIPDIIELMK